MTDGGDTGSHLMDHVRFLTETIGERSVSFPRNLERAAGYIESIYRDADLNVHREPFTYRDFRVANVVAEIPFCKNPTRHYLLGAHYDSVAGTVGADDNASAVAVQLETARALRRLEGREDLDLNVKFVSFTLEEPPAFNTRYRGSRVYAGKAKKKKEKIDGMICLEMVGYTCYEPGCQKYPFPLMFMDYPKRGDFIGIVGNFGSRTLTDALYGAFRKNPALPVVKLLVPLKGCLLPSVRLSDHSSFWDQGFHAVMVTDSAFYRNPHYHRPSDTMDKLDVSFMEEVVNSLLIFFRSHRRND